MSRATRSHRELAAQCLQLAAATTDKMYKSVLLRTAAKWSELAERGIHDSQRRVRGAGCADLPISAAAWKQVRHASKPGSGGSEGDGSPGPV
jgi:hypothetical protein